MSQAKLYTNRRGYTAEILIYHDERVVYNSYESGGMTLQLNNCVSRSYFDNNWTVKSS